MPTERKPNAMEVDRPAEPAGDTRPTAHADEVRPTNRLARETSPYLLQHAHNPVDWFAWGPEALDRARLADRPIFLSIGYAACHWCHVMERESFEDPATAADLNAAFVAIKVDREERPDLDAIYMAAVQALTGQGGWPISVFLTPDGRPFYGGTYFPNARRYGMPSFRDVMGGVAQAWNGDRAGVEAAASKLAQAVAAQQVAPVGAPPGAATTTSRLVGLDGQPLAAPRRASLAIGDAVLDAAVEGLERGFDPRGGGWGEAPKFPQPMALEFLLRRHVATGSERPLELVRRSLDAMAAGGIYDHLGGGFARYATDADWLVPHFEKMLYDNAQLARVYLHAWQVTAEPRYRLVVEETLGYVLRELRADGGAFAASQDADTAGVEGATYTWTAPKVAEVLGTDAPLFAAAYDVTPGGNWEGRTILRRVSSDVEIGAKYGLDAATVAGRLADARGRLLDARATRPQPARDGKALAAWNGLLLTALAEASVTLDRADFAQAATAAAEMLLARLWTQDSGLRRSWTAGRVGPAGVLEDYADLAEGLLALYQATFEPRWFVAARELLDRVLERFADPAGGFFDTADDHERLIARPKGLQDNALPSGSAMAATTLLRLHALTGNGRYREAAETALAQVQGLPERYPTGFAQWLNAMDLASRPLDEVAIVGARAEDTRDLLAVVHRGYRPSLVLAAAAGTETGSSPVPLLHDRPLLDGRATAYVCRGFVCQRPVTDPDALAAQLRPATESQPPKQT